MSHLPFFPPQRKLQEGVAREQQIREREAASVAERMKTEAEQKAAEVIESCKVGDFEMIYGVTSSRDGTGITTVRIEVKSFFQTKGDTLALTSWTEVLPQVLTVGRVSKQSPAQFLEWTPEKLVLTIVESLYVSLYIGITELRQFRNQYVTCLARMRHESAV